MSDGGASVVRLAAAAAAEEDPLHQDVFVHLSSSSSSSSSSPSPSLTVCAPAAWLSRVPYFATQLAEPWIYSSPQQQITLECTPGSSPQAYLQCFRLLSSSPTSWPSLLESVNEVLQILPVADHLLFQDCWDACMGFLASSPWSIEEEDAIRATISKFNMEPSLDVKERLDTLHDEAVLEALLRKMISTPSLHDFFHTWCQMCLNQSCAPFVAAFHRILLKVMESLSDGVRNVSLAEIQLHNSWLSRDWYVLAKFLLQFTDAQQFILHLVNSEHLLRALAYGMRREDSRHIFDQVLEKVEKRVVLLSNLQRARLVKWSKSATKSYHNTWLRLAETLPVRVAIRMEEINSNSECIPEWSGRVLHRMIRQMDEVSLDSF